MFLPFQNVWQCCQVTLSVKLSSDVVKLTSTTRNLGDKPQTGLNLLVETANGMILLLLLLLLFEGGSGTNCNQRVSQQLRKTYSLLSPESPGSPQETALWHSGNCFWVQQAIGGVCATAPEPKANLYRPPSCTSKREAKLQGASKTEQETDVLRTFASKAGDQPRLCLLHTSDCAPTK